MTEDVVPGRKPRVAIVVAGLDIVGGHSVQANELATGLRGDGYPVTLVPINPRFPPGLGWLRQIRYARTVVNQALYLPHLASLARADVVHVFSASYWAFVLAAAPALAVGRGLGKRVVLHYHSGEAADHLARWGSLVHPWLRLADTIVVPSHYLAQVFAGHGYPTRVIRNVVDLSRFDYHQRYPVGPRLLSNRNLEPHYGVSTVLRAFASLKQRVPSATLVVAGSGSEERHLRSLAVDGVHFAGSVPPVAMPALCAEADVFLNASTIDNQPVSILEAFASGLAVVSSPTGGIAEMLANGRGLVVPAGDPEAMAASVLALLERPETARTMTGAAREYVGRHTWRAVRQQWAAVYDGDGTSSSRTAVRSTPSRSWTSSSIR